MPIFLELLLVKYSLAGGNKIRSSKLCRDKVFSGFCPLFVCLFVLKHYIKAQCQRLDLDYNHGEQHSGPACQL
jgi:hypothetical protein